MNFDARVDDVNENIQIVRELEAERESLQQAIKENTLALAEEEKRTDEAMKRLKAESERADKLAVEIVELKAELRRIVQEKEHFRELTNPTEAIKQAQEATKQAHSLEYQLKRVGERLDDDECACKCARCD
jgi:hypothetical protein